MKQYMKTVMAIMIFAILLIGNAFAEDAISSATLSVDALPVIEKNEDANVLVVFFSTDDTIRAAAATAADALGADLYEIIPVEAYTDEDLNYYDSSTRATVEQRNDTARPAITALPESMDQYEVILLGYPIWWGQAPKILYTFVESVDLSGKNIIPFCTSASSSAGTSASNLAKLTDDSVTWQDVRRIANGDTAEDIRSWALSLVQ